MSDWLEYLVSRGINQKSIQRFAIGPYTYDDRPCLRYPTMNFIGAKAYRIKFTDGEKPKYKWDGSTDQSEFRYYSPGGLAKAIENAGGTLHWCAGEVDVWTWYQNGIDAVTCAFGEGSIPKTIADDFKTLGVKQVIMYPDLDTPGMKAAYKMVQALKDTDINLTIRRIPGEMESKRDLNQLWQDLNFDGWEMTKAGSEMKQIKPDELAMYETTSDKHIQPTIQFDSLFHEWIETVIKALGPYDALDGRIERWHCPCADHADKHPSFRVANGDRCKMPICTCSIQDLEPKEAWDKVATGIGAETWAEYKTRTLAKQRAVQPVKPNPPSTNGSKPAPALDDLWVDGHDVLKEISDHLEGLNVPSIEFVDGPLKVLHQFGGFAEIMFPGKLVYISGISGGGKTSLAETIGGVFLREGYDFVWYGPEWNPYEMGLRALQRQGGMSMIRVAEGFRWLQQGKQGIPPEKRKGSPFPEAARQDSLKKLYEMIDWPGHPYFLKPQANQLPLAEMLNVVRAIVNLKRSQGRVVTAFFFDYLQRANMKGRNDAYWAESVVTQIKSLCEELQIIGFVLVQPRKNDSAKARDGENLSEASGQGISDQQCNLYLAVTPVFQDDIRTEFATIKVVKNSMGRTGEVQVPTDFARLCWLDQEAHIVNINLREFGVGK